MDAALVPDLQVKYGAGVALAPKVPPEAFCNLYPYRPARMLAAGGGYVVRPGKHEPELLLIYRRGLWDIPKGKQDEGGDIEACALREVKEELGIRRVRLVAPLGTTLHTYDRRRKFYIKTTHWYLMKTPETRFHPQASEGIKQVSWVSWSEAEARLGFASLKEHLRTVEPIVRTHFGR